MSPPYKPRSWWEGLADAAAGDARRYADGGERRPALISARVATSIYERHADAASLRARDDLRAYLLARVGAQP